MMLEPIDLISEQMRDAAADPSAWPTALDSINAFLGASGVVMLSAEERRKHAPSSSDLTELMEDYFSNNWYTRDIREACRPLVARKGFALDHEFLERDQMEKGDYYTNFIAKHGRKWFACLGAKVDGDIWCLAIQRSPVKGPFYSSDLSRLKAVQARFAQSAAYTRRLNRTWLDGAFSAFDMTHSAAMILDWNGNILDMNEAARDIVGRYVDGQGLLRFPDARSSQAIAEIQRRSLDWRSPSTHATTQSEIMVGSKAYDLVSRPLLGANGLVFSRMAAIVQIIPVRFDVAKGLKIRFGMTDAECRIAMALARGLDVNEMAETFQVTQNTVRMQLKSTYSKTGTGSQAKLIALVNDLENKA